MFGFIEFDGAFGSVAPRAEMIDGAVARHREQPWAYRTAIGIEAADAVPDAQESLLHQIFGNAGVPDHAQNQPEHHLAIAVVELCQGLWIAPLQADHKLAVALRHNCEDQRKHRVTGYLRRSKDYSRRQHFGSRKLHTRDLDGRWESLCRAATARAVESATSAQRRPSGISKSYKTVFKVLKYAKMRYAAFQMERGERGFPGPDRCRAS